MTGPEHYRKAEEILSILDTKKNEDEWTAAIRDGEIAIAMQAAQAHATLALAATWDAMLTLQSRYLNAAMKGAAEANAAVSTEWEKGDGS